MTPSRDVPPAQLLREITDLRSRLEEAQKTLRAIREGELDAIIVSGSKGDRVFSLMESENLHRFMVEAMSEAGIATSPDGLVLFCNPRTATLLQRPQEQLLGRFLEEFVADHDRDRLRRLLEAAGTQVADDRILFVAADGTAVPMHLWASRLERAEGPMICLVGTDLSQLEARRDLIEQLQEEQRQLRAEMGVHREAEDALRAAEQQLRLAVEGANVGVWISEPGAGVFEASARTKELLGLPPAGSLTRQQALSRVHPDDRDALRAAVERSTSDGPPFSSEHRIVLPDGTVRWVATMARRIEEGGRVRLHGIMFDITPRKRAEEEARRQAEELRTLMDITPAAICVAEDPQCARVSGNRAARQLYEAAEGENLAATPKGARRFFRDGQELAPEELPMQIAAATGRGVPDCELDVVLPSGKHVAIWGSATPLRDADGNVRGCIGAFVDITERKRVQEELRAARDSAERAKAAAESATRAKDRFLAVLSHELRTPLAPVLTGVSLLQLEPPASEHSREYLDVIRRNVELESRLIEDLLDLTRIAQGRVELHKRRVELTTIIERAVEVCRPDIEARRLHFGVDAEPGPYPLDVDAARLQQVLWNLIKNAIKFTPMGGCVGVRCRREGGQVVVEVNDSGIGIEPRALPSIFDAFAQADPAMNRQFGGLGLGLAISKSLVEMHGGTIEARSGGRGKGSSFRVRLPLAESEEAESAGTIAPDEASEEPLSLRILLVEDHGDTAMMTVKLLELDGHKVETAGDVAAALQMVERSEFDLLISDLGLPDRSGLELMRELRARGMTLHAIALSGYGQLQDVERSRAAGFQVHLVKPLEPSRLLDTIRRMARSIG
ncbi:MAG TPA: PAS domain S-box protein [Vicinamibacterales bacterium]|nr:PAS domain S-box protein [Vicinamibacterales bacterium]